MTSRPAPPSSSPRHLAFEGIDNIRDLGGLNTTDGRRTRAGRLLRSSAVHEVTEEDVRRLTQLHGIRLVLDLRSHTEIDKTGRGLLSRWVEAYVNLPIRSTSTRAVDTLIDTSLPGMLEHYIGYLAHSHAQIAIAARLLASPAHLPALFHCAAGKDRTGVLTAVLLDALGVVHDEIVADYALSQERMQALITRLSREPDFKAIFDAVPPYALDAQPATMRDLLTHLQTEHGGASGWLQGHGLEAEVIERLKAALLE